jgi:hypothetical protein
MKTTRKRKIVNATLDPELVDWLHTWRQSQVAVIPIGRAIDAAILALREKDEARAKN